MESPFLLTPWKWWKPIQNSLFQNWTEISLLWHDSCTNSQYTPLGKWTSGSMLHGYIADSFFLFTGISDCQCRPCGILVRLDVMWHDFAGLFLSYFNWFLWRNASIFLERKNVNVYALKLRLCDGASWWLSSASRSIRSFATSWHSPWQQESDVISCIESPRRICEEIDPLSTEL